MIEHVVYFSANPGQHDNLTKTLAQFCLDIQAALPGVSEITSGVNFNLRSAQFTHALVSRIDSKATLDAYAVHPIHLDLIRKLNESLAAERFPLDYEIKA